MGHDAGHVRSGLLGAALGALGAGFLGVLGALGVGFTSGLGAGFASGLGGVKKYHPRKTTAAPANSAVSPIACPLYFLGIHIG